ncbi:hypothetical protein EII14_02615 [Alloprevotella sp. OH1205_COT-284]|uniref:hypothetical protein n=1 Tax=Alloprevotella sp. OH1205_COT-284 TaxID=2491043 RepID=UPI000F5F2BE5|nr:hypothetical protein [Alloprevotella sp. OH1205_COT-284]RRD80375.1 hypothetical protein EII14_02615 [Alloprevotella sp. OH1205_COT-284]
MITTNSHTLRGVLLFFFLTFSVLIVRGQQTLVGVNTNKPTEDLHVKGTLRVGNLPVIGEKHYGTPALTATPSTVYSGKNALLVDKNGVLGKAIAQPRWTFYMPPILLPLDPTYAKPGEYVTASTLYQIDLYARYKEQFLLQETTSSVRSNNSSSLPLFEKELLNFFVVYYDAEVFENVAVSNEGMLTYRVKANCNPTERTFMNILFSVKPISD